jgi:hypothetical protein
VGNNNKKWVKCVRIIKSGKKDEKVNEKNYEF